MILRTRRAATRGAAAATGLTLALLLSACGADGETDAEPSPTPSDTATAEPDDDGPMDANQACAAMYVEDEDHLDDRIALALLDVHEQGIGGGNADRMHALSIELADLASRVPEEFRGPVEQIRVPFLQLQEHLDAMGGGEVQLDVGSATEGLKAYKALC